MMVSLSELNSFFALIKLKEKREGWGRKKEKDKGEVKGEKEKGK